VRVVRLHGAAVWTAQFVCNACKSLIEVEKNDLTFIADSRDGSAYTFECPTCHGTVWIDATLVSPS
jgi:hypothetical protein